MRPELLLSLAFFAVQWGINARNNYEFFTQYPSYARQYNVMPRVLMNRLGAEFSLIVTSAILSTILLAFIFYGINYWLIFVGGIAIAMFNLYEKQMIEDIKKSARQPVE